MKHATNKLATLWWPQIQQPQQPTRGQRGKPSPESVARRARRDQVIADIFGELPCKGEPRRQLWEQITRGQVQADPELVADIDAGMAEFGDGFKVSGRHAERVWKKTG